MGVERRGKWRERGKEKKEGNGDRWVGEKGEVEGGVEIGRIGRR